MIGVGLGVRKRILFSHLVVLAFVLLILFPSVEILVNRVMKANLVAFCKTLVEQLKKQPNLDAMLQFMKTSREFVLRPISLLDAQGNVIYHSYLPSMSDEEISQIQRDEPEVQQAMKKGVGFDQHISPFFNEPSYFVAIRFEYQGSVYILHKNYSSLRIDQLKYHLEFFILILLILVIGVITVLDMSILRKTLHPIQVITEEIENKPVTEFSIESQEFEEEFIGLAKTLNDLSKRIRQLITDLVQQKEETVEILETLGEGIVAVDPKSCITFMNQAAASMLKSSPKTPKLPANDFGRQCQKILDDTLKTSKSQQLSQKIGSAYIDLIGIPLVHQKGALLVLQDKTADHQIIELGREFIANASHELRTPVTIIRGFAETLQDLPELSGEMLRDITGKIVKTCVRLEKLIKSLLSLSNADQLSMDTFSSIDLSNIAEHAKHLLLLAHPETNIQFFSCEEKVVVHGNQNLIELSILNLLENAVKYSKPPAQIEMRLKKVGNEAHLSIQDHGIGISDADLPHIFVRFFRVDKARTQFGGGAGLGLSIVKTIIEKHRGKIEVASELGKGSAFTIILPLI